MTASTRISTRRNRPARARGATTTTWVIQEEAHRNGPPTFTVLRGGRQLACDLTEKTARQMVAEKMCSNDRILHEHPDGYRQEITKLLR